MLNEVSHLWRPGPLVVVITVALHVLVWLLPTWSQCGRLEGITGVDRAHLTPVPYLFPLEDPPEITAIGTHLPGPNIAPCRPTELCQTAYFQLGQEVGCSLGGRGVGDSGNPGLPDSSWLVGRTRGGKDCHQVFTVGQVTPGGHPHLSLCTILT